MMCQKLRQQLQLFPFFLLLAATATAQPTADFYWFDPVCEDVPEQFFNATTSPPTWPNPYRWFFPGGTPATSSATNPTVTFATPGMKICTLQVLTPSGQVSSTKIQTVEVLPGPAGDFDWAASGQEINFEFTGADIDFVHWAFGDGQTSDPQSTDPFFQITHEYNDPGIYTVTATATGNCGATITRTQTVFTEFAPDFDATSETGICPGEAISFENLSNFTAGVSWLWEFPGGSPTGSTSVSSGNIVYNSPGIYEVKLTAFLPGSTFVETKTAFITVKDLPLAAFTYLIDNQTVAFQNSSQNADDFLWDFGGNGDSDEETPIFDFSEDGDYNVVLTAQNECGEDTATAQISIATLPTAAFGYSSIYHDCQNFTVSVVANPSANADDFTLYFPGSNLDSSKTIYTDLIYPPGDFVVTMVVWNENGADTFSQNLHLELPEKPSAKFSLQRISGEEFRFKAETNAPGTDLFWQFGDGQTASGSPNVSHLFPLNQLFKTVLTASNACFSASDSLWVCTLWPSGGGGFLAVAQNLDSCPPARWLLQMPRNVQPDSMLWTIPGGVPSVTTDWNPIIYVASPGVYDITLVVFQGGQRDTFFQQNAIAAFGSPSANFDFLASGLNVVFQNLSPGNSNVYRWDFGDGLTSTLPNPTHFYQTAGTYNVELLVKNACGSDTLRKVLTIAANALPEAGFGFAASNFCQPVEFDDASQNAETWFWQFPGGIPATSTEQNPTVSYPAPGTYSVSLTVGNSFGQNTENQTFTLNGVPAPDAEFYCGAQGGRTFYFGSLGFQAGPFFWDFGDGTTSNLETLSHTFAEDGVFTVTRIVQNQCLADTFSKTVQVWTAPLADIDFANASGSTSCAPATFNFQANASPNAQSFFWEFPGGQPANSTLQNPSVTFPNAGFFSVKLTVSNPGFSFLDSALVVVNSKPLSHPGLLGVNGSTAQFYSQSDPTAAHFWNFGDGSTSTAVSPDHTFSADGVYQVSLVTANDCGSDTAFLQVAISASGLPVALFSVGDTVGCAPIAVQFQNLSANATSFSWNFPGGNPAVSTEANPLVTYSVSGTYTATLTATNANGSSQFSKTQQILVDALPAVASFTATPQPPNAGAYFFEANASPGTSSYDWDFGDGQTASGQTASHVFLQNGVFAVTLFVENHCAADTQTVLLAVSDLNPPPVSNFEVSFSSGCQPLTVEFDDQSQNATAWAWFFPGGQPAFSSEQNPTVTYAEPGVFDVVLVVSNAFGLDTLTKTGLISVNPLPQADFDFSVFGSAASFFNQSAAAISLVWDFGDGATSTDSDPHHIYMQPGTYLVRLTASNVCGVSVKEETLILDFVAAPEASLFGSMRVFPNPSAGDFWVEILGQPSAEPLLLFLENGVGQCLQTQVLDFGNGQALAFFSGEGFSAGVYTVAAFSGGSVVRRRFVFCNN